MSTPNILKKIKAAEEGVKARMERVTQASVASKVVSPVGAVVEIKKGVTGVQDVAGTPKVAPLGSVVTIGGVTGEEERKPEASRTSM